MNPAMPLPAVPAHASGAAGAPPNLNRLNQLTQELERITKQRKTFKNEMAGIQEVAKEGLLRMNKLFIDESNNGSGPFWTIVKKTTKASWNKERLEAFFTQALIKQREGTTLTPQLLVVESEKFIKQFDKRDIDLKKQTRPPMQRNCDHIRAYLQGQTPE